MKDKFNESEFERLEKEEGVRVICGGFQPIKEAESVIEFNGKPVISSGDTAIVWGGKCSGKSHLAALLAAACIAPRPIDGALWIPDGKKMLIVDTEQTNNSLTWRWRRAINTAGTRADRTEHGETYWWPARYTSVDKRISLVREMVKRINPDIIYIDELCGLADDMKNGYSKNVAQLFRDLADGQRVVIGTCPTEYYDIIGTSPDCDITVTKEGDVFSVKAECRDVDFVPLLSYVITDNDAFRVTCPAGENEKQI